MCRYPCHVLSRRIGGFITPSHRLPFCEPTCSVSVEVLGVEADEAAAPYPHAAEVALAELAVDRCLGTVEVVGGCHDVEEGHAERPRTSCDSRLAAASHHRSS